MAKVSDRNSFKSDSEYCECTRNEFLQESFARKLLQSLSKPFLFYIAAQILSWVCQLQQFMQKLFCSKNNESYIPDYSDAAISYSPDRIVGGVPADISEAPFMLSIQMFNRHFCVAAIISVSWALTAAQCFPKYYAIRKMHLRGGANRVPGYGYEYKLTEVIMHKNYSMIDGIPDYDVAVIKPAVNFEIEEGLMESIPIATMAIHPDDGPVGTIFGWGALKENDYSKVRILHKADVPILWEQHCRKYMKEVRIGQCCAGHLEGGIGHCEGNTGGPLIFKNHYYGTFSWGHGCGRLKKPGVYTEIKYYLPWIKTQTKI